MSGKTSTSFVAASSNVTLANYIVEKTIEAIKELSPSAKMLFDTGDASVTYAPSEHAFTIKFEDGLNNKVTASEISQAREYAAQDEMRSDALGVLIKELATQDKDGHFKDSRIKYEAYFDALHIDGTVQEMAKFAQERSPITYGDIVQMKLDRYLRDYSGDRTQAGLRMRMDGFKADL